MSCLISPAFWVYIILLIAAVAIIRIVVPWIKFKFFRLSLIPSPGSS